MDDEDLQMIEIQDLDEAQILLDNKSDEDQFENVPYLKNNKSRSNRVQSAKNLKGKRFDRIRPKQNPVYYEDDKQ